MNNKNILRSLILNKAADLIELDGWWQLGGKVKRGHCAATALSLAFDILSDIDYLNASKQYSFLTKEFNKITSWNDHPNQTKENVISHLRFVANEYKKRALKNEQ